MLRKKKLLTEKPDSWISIFSANQPQRNSVALANCDVCILFKLANQSNFHVRYPLPPLALFYCWLILWPEKFMKKRFVISIFNVPIQLLSMEPISFALNLGMWPFTKTEKASLKIQNEKCPICTLAEYRDSYEIPIFMPLEIV